MCEAMGLRFQGNRKFLFLGRRPEIAIPAGFAARQIALLDIGSAIDECFPELGDLLTGDMKNPGTLFPAITGPPDER